jgi:trehalose-6-phosphate synthase
MSKKTEVFGQIQIITSIQILDYIRGMNDEERTIFFNELLEEPYLELDGNTSYIEAGYDYDFKKI